MTCLWRAQQSSGVVLMAVKEDMVGGYTLTMKDTMVIRVHELPEEMRQAEQYININSHST